MQTNTQTKNLHDGEKAEFENYLETKIPAIAKFFEKLPDDQVKFDCKIEKTEKHSAYICSLMLTIGGDVLKAEEAAHSITKAVDDAKDRLVREVTKRKEKRMSHR